MKANWPPIKKITNHEKPAFMVDARIQGKGERRFFPSKREANAFAALCRARRVNEGVGATADARLAANGWTVRQAIDFALDHLDRQARSTPLSSAVEALIEQKDKAGKSRRYKDDLRSRLKRLIEAMPGQAIAAVTTADLEEFIHGLNVAPGTANTFRRDINTLWTFAEKRGWAQAKTARLVEKVAATPPPPAILTPGEAAALMAHTRDLETKAFHAIALFAGLRTAEIKRLDWCDIDLAGGYIHVAVAVSKTRTRRLVPILPNLEAWLRPLASSQGKVVTRDIRLHCERARRSAGIAWHPNVMRHSFVSYRLADTNDAARTALEAGHDQAVLFAHYRELVRPEAARRYFGILPSAPGKVIPITPAA